MNRHILNNTLIKMSRKTVILVLSAALITVMTASCAKHDPAASATDTSASEQEETAPAAPKEPIVIEDETEAETETEPEEIPDERIEVDGKIRSYLTGEMVDVKVGNRRPLAIMMSNDKEARPQYGMNRAGVVYEAPVEGTLVRYMSLIEDYDDLDRIGSVRSCRTYYTYFAREWDAVYAHFGQSTFALPYLENVDNINGLTMDSAYYRSKDKKSPHNAYSSGDRINKAIEKLGYRTEYDPDYESKGGHFKFAKPGEEINFTPEESLEAMTIKPGYPYNKPWFEYNKDDGLYYRFQYGEKHMGDEGQVAVKNVIFQYFPTSRYATTDYLNINVHEDSYGYFFTNGRYVPVSVKKDGEFGVTHYYKMDGEEIILNPGKTWICTIQSQNFLDTQILDADGNRTDNR